MGKKTSLFAIGPFERMGSPTSPYTPLSLQKRLSGTCHHACPWGQVMRLRYTWLHLPHHLGERGLSRRSPCASSGCRSRNAGVLTKPTPLSSRNAPLNEAAIAPKAAVRYPRRYATKKRRRGGTRSPRVPGREGGRAASSPPRAPPPPALPPRPPTRDGALGTSN